MNKLDYKILYIFVVDYLRKQSFIKNCDIKKQTKKFENQNIKQLNLIYL